MDRSIKGERTRDMKKRLVILLSNILSIILIAISLSGCKLFQSRDPWKKKQIDGEFYYYVKNESAIILGLVDEEKEREELVMPETLGGYPVKQIGESFAASVGSRTKHYGIDATNIERIVINNECRIKDETSITNLNELVINADVGLGTAAYDPEINIIIFKIDFSSMTYYEAWAKTWEYDWIKKQVVTFDSVGGKQKTYAIALNQAEKLLEPEEPNKEGFTFSGWYVDEEYITKWNFETDVVTENITLYAKWIEA